MDRPGRQRRAERQQSRIRNAAPPPRGGIRSGVHRPLAARPVGRFDLQPGRRHRPSDPPAGVYRAQRVVRTECRRSVRNGLHRHFALRVRACDAAFRRPGRGARRSRNHANGARHPADRRPLGEPEYGGDKTALSAIDSRRAGRPDRPDQAFGGGNAGRHQKGGAGHLVARTYRPCGERHREKPARAGAAGSRGPFRRGVPRHGFSAGAAARHGPAAARDDSRTDHAPRSGGRGPGTLLARLDAERRRRPADAERPDRPGKTDIRCGSPMRQPSAEPVPSGRLAGRTGFHADGRGRRIRSVAAADTGKRPDADRPRGVPEPRFRRNRAGCRPRKPAPLRPPFRPRRSAPSAAVRFGNADGAGTADRRIGQCLRLRSGRHGNHPGADRRIVRARCRRFRFGCRRPHVSRWTAS